MGLTYLAVEVGNPSDPENTLEIEFLVDSGAVNSVVPASVLDSLGILRLTQRKFRLANGTAITRSRGGAMFKYLETIGVADVIFGEEGDSTLLGATTLEALGVALDPVKRELRPLPMVL
jgi:clan AA aspartic protease